jgi:hypothetical protein
MQVIHVIVLLLIAFVSPASAPEATNIQTSGFHACPLPIPACVPEKVFDFKTCRCVERP